MSGKFSVLFAFLLASCGHLPQVEIVRSEEPIKRVVKAEEIIETKYFPVHGMGNQAFRLKYGLPLPAEDARIRVDLAGFMVDRVSNELYYSFGFTEKTGQAPREVVVEDMSRALPLSLVEDRSPVLSPDGRWVGGSARVSVHDLSAAWLREAGDTEKVFRFSVISASGENRVRRGGRRFVGWGANPTGCFPRM